MQCVDVMRSLCSRASARGFDYSSSRDACQPATSTLPQSKSKQLFIRNLPSSFTEAELREMFEEFGVVTRSAIVRTRTGNTRWEAANGTPGPFTQAQTRFICNGIIPLVAGFFADVNEDFDKTIRLLAERQQQLKKQHLFLLCHTRIEELSQ